MDKQEEKKARQKIKDIKEGFDSGMIDEKLRLGDADYYDKVTLNYPFGIRLAYRKKDQNDYELLQSSLSVPADYTLDIATAEIESLLKPLTENIIKLEPGDESRCEELEYISAMDSIPEFNLFSLGSFCELGFRVPRLLKHYCDTHGMLASGYDVLELNIIAGRHVGYDVHRYDFDECEEDLRIDADLVVSYHMLEHVTDPLQAVIKIHDAMKPGAFFHVEIPVEGPGMPNIRYSHMYAFHPRDMEKMLTLAGFRALSCFEPMNQRFGAYVERYLVQKIENGRTLVRSTPNIDHYRTWEMNWRT